MSLAKKLKQKNQKIYEYTGYVFSGSFENKRF